MEAPTVNLPANGPYLFNKISVSDLLKLETQQPPSQLLITTFISTLTSCPIFTTIPEVLPLDSIVLQDSSTVILVSSTTIVLFTSQADLETTRVNMKKSGCLNKFEAFEIPSIYTIIGIIRLWLKFKSDLLTFLDKLNYSGLASESVKALENFIYTKAGVKQALGLLAWAKNQQSVKFDSEVKIFRALTKPLVELGVSKLRSGEASLDYTESEDTEEMNELSFRVSELFKEKFPRFSAASITVMDTPGKEIRKSYLEYSEMIESPRYHLNNYMKTPLDSPKQANLTIVQVKERLESVGTPESSPSKPSSKSKRNKFDFESDIIKSLNTELTGCSETQKPQMPFETKFRSCQCSSCSIM